ncbi:MAG: mycothiol maleylpyruvate isomerase, partial [Acidimicrobiales bacterium]
YEALEGAQIDHAAVAARGRAAGAALGERPRETVAALADRVLALIAHTADDATLTVAGGKGATLAAYLPTRTFELTVHTLDLLGALGQDAPRELSAPVASCLELVGQIAGRRPDASKVLLALTGRGRLPPGFSVI